MSHPLPHVFVKQVRLIKRTCFTLVEILMVLVLVGIAAGLTAIKIRDVYSEQQYLTEVQQVANHLQMAQELMLMMQYDISAKFYKNGKNNLIYQLIVKEPLPPRWAKLIEKPYELKAIRRIDFNEQSTENHEGILLTFFSRGMAMVEGRMVFSKTDNPYSTEQTSQSNYQINLFGYPHMIESSRYRSASKEESPLRDIPKQGLYPNALLDELYEKAK